MHILTSLSTAAWLWAALHGAAALPPSAPHQRPSTSPSLQRRAPTDLTPAQVLHRQRARYFHREKEWNAAMPLLFDDDALEKEMWAYVLDSGVRGDHPEFLDDHGRSRVEEGESQEGSGWDGEKEDHTPDGHGTAVASLIGGRTAGVLRSVRIVDVRVAPNDRSRTFRIAGGLEWAIADIRLKGRVESAVINISCGSFAKNEKPEDNEKVLKLATKARELGIPVFVAAGNLGRRLTKGKDNGEGEAPSAPTKISGQHGFPAQLKEVITVGGADYDMNVLANEKDPGAGGATAREKTNRGSRVNLLAAGTLDASLAANWKWNDEEGQPLLVPFGQTSAAAAFASGGELYLQALEELKGADRINRVLERSENEAVRLTSPEDKTHKRFLFIGKRPLI